MLENIWLIPAVTAASFVLIIFFGKKEPNQGATIGILALTFAFAFSSLAAFQWITRPADFEVEPAHSIESVEGDDHGTTGAEHTEEESEPDHRIVGGAARGNVLGS